MRSRSRTGGRGATPAATEAMRPIWRSGSPSKTCARCLTASAGATRWTPTPRLALPKSCWTSSQHRRAAPFPHPLVLLRPPLQQPLRRPLPLLLPPLLHWHQSRGRRKHAALRAWHCPCLCTPQRRPQRLLRAAFVRAASRARRVSGLPLALPVHRRCPGGLQRLTPVCRVSTRRTGSCRAPSGGWFSAQWHSLVVVGATRYQNIRVPCMCGVCASASTIDAHHEVGFESPWLASLLPTQ